MSAAKMDLAEFRDLGLLQEVNRRILHPLGLALYVEFDDDGEATGMGVFDDRDDPEGWYFYARNDDDRDDYLAKAASVADMAHTRVAARRAALGYWVQPLTDLEHREHDS